MRISDWSSDVCSSDLLDVWLQGSRMDGLELLDEIKRDYPNLPVVLISGHGNIEMAVTAIKRGAYDFIEKPFKADRLLLMVDRAIEAARLKRENAELKLRAGADGELVGQAPVIVQLRQQVERRSEEHTSELQSLMRISYAV